MSASIPADASETLAGSSNVTTDLQAGFWARLQSLKARPELNGCACRLLQRDEGSGRWAVRLAVSGESVRVKPSSLMLAPAPASHPTVRGLMCERSDDLLADLQAELTDYLSDKPQLGMDGADGLGRLFEALAASHAFTTKFFGQRPFVLECGEAAAYQWTVDDSVALLLPASYPECKAARAPITLQKYSKFTHPEISRQNVHSFMAIADEKPVLNSQSVRDALLRGSWVISGGNELAPTLSGICGALQDAFGTPFVTLNVYMSHLDTAICAPLHTDRFDSFIFQTEGSKRWRVFGTSEHCPPWPVLDAGVSDRGKNGDVLYLQQVGPLLLDECLKPGDVLYLPRGHAHATSTFDTASMYGRGSTAPTQYSTSCTVSLLLESVGLTYDKLLRCAAGMSEGRNESMQCLSAEEVLHATPLHKELRQVLPIGFLSVTLPATSKKEPGDIYAGSGAANSAMAVGEPIPPVAAVPGEAPAAPVVNRLLEMPPCWAEAVVEEAKHLASSCGLSRLVALGEELDDLLLQIAKHVWNVLPAARTWCRERVFATGSVLSALAPDDRHDAGERALVDFLFYPEAGRIYVQAPSILPRAPVL